MSNMDIFSGDGIDEVNKTMLTSKQKVNDSLPWVAKYSPKCVDDVILPQKLRNMIKFALQNNKFTHFCFHSGKPGTGKTSTAIAIAEEFETDYQVFYISEKPMECIDSIRNYASQKNVDGKPRFVILDEADTPKMQDPSKFYTALQPLIESTTSTLRFILTCNNLYKIQPAILSRCTPISFAYDVNDADIKLQVFRRMKEIAKNEVLDNGGTVDNETIKAIIKFYYPDIRSITQQLQVNYMENLGSIAGTPSLISYENLDTIWDYILKVDDENLRKFVTLHVVDFVSVYAPFGSYVMEHIDKKYRLSFSVLLGKYQVQSAMPAVDQEINLNSFFASIMLLLQGK